MSFHARSGSLHNCWKGGELPSVNCGTRRTFMTRLLLLERFPRASEMTFEMRSPHTRRAQTGVTR